MGHSFVFSVAFRRYNLDVFLTVVGLSDWDFCKHESYIEELFSTYET